VDRAGSAEGHKQTAADGLQSQYTTLRTELLQALISPGETMRHLIATFALLLATLPAPAGEPDKKEKAEGFVSLLDGKGLDGWKVYDARKPEVWAAEDGLLVCKGEGGGWLGSTRDYDNFVLRLEYRLKPGGNSGVYIRAPEKGHISRVGMEIQILDDPWYKDEKNYKGIKPTQLTGAVYGVAPPTQDAVKAAGEWNAMEIRADGRRVVVTLNGKKIVDADLDRYLKDEAIAKEHPGLSRKTGRIGLQSHSERVEFRNLRLKPLK
jgi:Domain of Unknown Function (DUF1080)